MDNELRQLERMAAIGDEMAAAKLARMRERSDILPPFGIVVNGEDFTCEKPTDSCGLEHGVAQVRTECGQEYILAPDSEVAGKVARERWREMAENEPTEFRLMVGDDVLVAWALGLPAGPGSTKVSSLDEWLDLYLDAPEEDLASYDGEECAVERVSATLCEALGFIPTVAYRTN